MTDIERETIRTMRLIRLYEKSKRLARASGKADHESDIDAKIVRLEANFPIDTEGEK